MVRIFIPLIFSAIGGMAAQAIAHAPSLILE